MPVRINELPPCLEPASPTRGKACEDCDFLREGVRCVSLAAGQKAVEQAGVNQELAAVVHDLTKEKKEWEREKLALIERLLNLRTDTLIETAFTPEGLRDHLHHDRDIQEELAELNWGVLRLDGRFVNYLNRAGNWVGDAFLQKGGAHITALSDGLVRTEEQPIQEERRAQRQQGHSMANDIICRQGGDEFSILIRNVSPDELTAITARIRALLTPSKAVDRYHNGQIPFIASVGFGHAESLNLEVARECSTGNHYQAFYLVNNLADDGQRKIKSRQYEIMWDMAQELMPQHEFDKWIAQPDDRQVAELFLRYCCPDFHRDPLTFMRRQQDGQESTA